MKIKNAVLSGMTLMILLSACNRPPEQPTSTTEKKTTPTENTVCKTLTIEMTKINDQSTLEQLDQINQQLKNCVATANNIKQLQWIEESSNMYQRFLSSEKNTSTQYNAFSDYGYALLQQESNASTTTTLQNALKNMSPRDQYLIKNQGKSYIDLQYVGEGIFQYRRHPQYLVDLVVPHLPKDQQAFIIQMHKDNLDIFMNDAAITISWQALAERTLFWEKYLTQYPNGHFSKDAKQLFNEYHYLLFLGTANTPVSDEFAPHTWINEEALSVIKNLAQQKDTLLATQAQKFLTFVNTPIATRNQQFKLDPLDDRGEVKEQYALTYEQLQQFLKLSTPWDHDLPPRDCHTDAICLALPIYE